MPWDETDQYIRSGHRAVGSPCRTITISAEQGIKAIYCKYGEKWGIQSYLFSKGKGWNISKAKAWFRSHRETLVGEPRHPDFEKIYQQFVKRYGAGKGEDYYYAWVKKRGLDDTKPYSRGAQLRESFRWAEQHIRFFKRDRNAKYYRVEAGFPVSSMNRTIYTEEELMLAARTLVRNHTDLNHNLQHVLDGADVVAAEYEDGAVEVILRVQKDAVCPKGHNLIKLIDSGEIDHVSIEGYCQSGVEETEEGKVCKGLVFTGLALLNQEELPGIPLTRILPFESIQESIFGDVEISELKEVIKITKENGENVQEQFAVLPDSSFACIIGSGEDKIRKLPIHDVAHTRNAMARYNQAAGCQTEETKAKICRAARKFGVAAAFEKGGFCYAGEAKESVEALEEIAELQKQVADLRGEQVELQKELEDERDIKAQISKGFAEKLEEVAKIQKEKAKVTEKLAKFNEDLDRTRKSWHETEDKLRGAQGRIDELTGEIDSLHTSVTGFEEKAKEWAKEKGGLEQRSTSYLRQLKDESEKRASADQRVINEMKERSKIEETNAQLNEENAEYTRKLSDLSGIRADLAKRLNKSEKELAKLKEVHQELVGRFKKQKHLGKIIVKT